MARVSAGIAMTGTGHFGAAVVRLPANPNQGPRNDGSMSADTGARFGMSGRLPQPVGGEGVNRRQSTKETCTQECSRAATQSFAEEEI
jgi:hypothetical protein